jgi:hypothetical protein
MVSSSGACEWMWSMYDFIHSSRRTKLRPDRATDLVYVYNNMQLISKFGQPEKFADWVDGEESDDEEENSLESH